MYESAARRRREEVQLHNAARIIQHRWRQLLARREDELERQRYQANPSGAVEDGGAAGIGAGGGAMESEKTDEEQLMTILDEYEALLAERERLIEKNLEAQRTASKYFLYQRVRKGESKMGNPVTPEFEEAYWGSVQRLPDERRRLQGKRSAMEQELDRQRSEYQSTIDEAIRQEDAFRNYIREASTGAVFMRSTNSPFPLSVMEKFIEQEQEQRYSIQSARVRLIQLQNFLKKLNRSANEEHTTDNNPNNGMYLIDFEQLKIENTNLNEKIEERNEDLVKLRRKVTTTIHVLTHVKEKLEFMKAENAQLRQQVQVTEEELSGVRDQLAQTKRRRDGFSKNNLKMKEKMPLVGMEDLLMDYEMRKTTIERTRVNVVNLTERHRELLDEIERQLPGLDRLRREISRYPIT